MAKSKWDKSRGFGRCLRGNLLTILTITGVIAGVAVGLILKEVKSDWTKREVTYVKYAGELFLNMLKGLIIPLIVSSLIAAVGSLDLSLSSKIGGRGIAFYMTTTLMAIILGIILAVSIRPGKNGNPDTNEKTERIPEPSLVEDTLMDLVRTMFPPNLIEATMYHAKSVLTPRVVNGTVMVNESYELYERKATMEGGTNIMGLVVFSIVLGIALAKLGESGKALIKVFQAMSEAMMLITSWVIWLSPVGITFLIAGEIVGIDDFNKVLESLGLYFATVVTGLVIHGFIVLPLIFSVMTRTLPFRFIANMSQAILTAFGTGSSSATLPISIKCLEENNKIDARVSRFLLPIGATINMDGTALYEAVAAIFIAQLYDYDLSFGKLVAISVTATAASIGAAGIPQAGLVTMVMVLDVIGLPGEAISYIVPIDWLLDRFRTAVNVLGDSVGAGIVDHLSQDELSRLTATGVVATILPTTHVPGEQDDLTMDSVKVIHNNRSEHENRGYEIDH